METRGRWRSAAPLLAIALCGASLAAPDTAPPRGAPEDTSGGALRPEAVEIPAGRFVMGGPGQRADRLGEATPHAVEITRPFLISRTEITQAQYRRVTGTSPSRPEFAGATLLGEELPVHSMSWFEAVDYCNRLSEREGLAPAYRIEGDRVTWDRDAPGWRLPTEAEWEYAARAGTTDRYVWGDDEATLCRHANLRDASMVAALGREGGLACDDGYVGFAQVGSYPPNAWGLHDMLGNAWEWVWDWYAPHDGAAAVDPVGPPDGEERGFRGAAWWSQGSAAPVEHRHKRVPTYRDADIGFRVARSLSGEPTD